MKYPEVLCSSRDNPSDRIQHLPTYDKKDRKHYGGVKLIGEYGLNRLPEAFAPRGNVFAFGQFDSVRRGPCGFIPGDEFEDDWLYDQKFSDGRNAKRPLFRPAWGFPDALSQSPERKACQWYELGRRSGGARQPASGSKTLG